MKMKLPLPKPPIKKPQQVKITKQNIGEINKKLDAASKAFRAAIQQGDYEDAYKQLLPALKLVPNHAPVLMDTAYTQLKLGRYEKAYQYYLNAIECSAGNVNTNIYDGLAEVCHFLGKKEQLIKFGRLAIESKKRQVADQAKIEISAHRPLFNPNNPQENIIAYSLFGDLPRYCETSIINIDLAKEIYPEWTCRFYVDQSVPAQVQARLKAKGAQVIQVTAEQNKMSGLFWRFFVMNDPSVNCFLIRDADSLVSYRERAAVDEWLSSDRWFHCMHDYYSHTELILAGMWGGFNGVFEHLEQSIEDYIRTGQYLSQRVADQHFLRHRIWPTLAQSVVIHDSQSFDERALDFPIHTEKKDFELFSQFHVGMNEGSSEVYAEVTLVGVQYVDWTLVDEKNQEICRYTAEVLDDSKIVIELPRSYAHKLESKEWKLFMYPTENTD